MARRAVGGFLFGLPRARGPPPLRGDPARRQRARYLRHRVQPVLLAPPSEHDQVTAPGREVDRLTAAIVTEPVGVPARLEEPGPAGAEREDGDDRVLAVAQVGVTVERDAVATVAV